MRWISTSMGRNDRDKYERIIHLLREIEYARSQLPCTVQGTGQISTAIGWMEKRVFTLTEELKKYSDE